MYYLTPHKCAIFGVCCEAGTFLIRKIPIAIKFHGICTCRSTTSLMKQSTPGREPITSSVCSTFLAMHNFGEAHLHTDNCSGQNKNRYIMQYLEWYVLSGLNISITLSFLIVGHTKFSPDWCFGLLKQAYRQTRNKDRVLGQHRASGRVISSCQPCSTGGHSRRQGSRTHI